MLSKDRSEIQSKYTKTKESSVNKNGYVQKYVRKSEQNVVFLEGNKKSSTRESYNLKYQICQDVKNHN